jgi:hypothetical protein
MTWLREMRARGPSLLVMLLVSAVLLSGTALAHVHDGSVIGLYDAECPAYELARQTSGPPLSSPDVAALERVLVVVPVAVDAQPTEDFPAIASPRAPPLG